MIKVIIDASGSMSCLGKSEIVQCIIREMQLTQNFEYEFFAWGETVTKLEETDEWLEIEYKGKSSVSCLVEFLQKNGSQYMLITDAFCKEDKTELTSFFRDNSNVKFRIVLVGADSNIVNAKSFFQRNLIASDFEKLIFTSAEVSATLESFYF